MIRSMLAAVVLVTVFACDAGSPLDLIEGTPASDIIAGNGQVLTADQVDAEANKRLPETVIHKMVRTPAGIRSVRYASGMASAVDTLNGSPIAGAVVCAGGGNGGLVPFSVCTNTTAQGTSIWVFSATTTAGEATVEIRGYLNDDPVVFDTAIATVLPGIPDSNGVNDAIAQRLSPAVFQVAHVQDRFGNATPYRIPSDEHLTAQDTVLGSEGARTVTFTEASADSVWRTITLTGEAGPIAKFSYRIVHASGIRIQAVICGLKVDPCESELWKP